MLQIEIQIEMIHYLKIKNSIETKTHYFISAVISQIFFLLEIGHQVAQFQY